MTTKVTTEITRTYEFESLARVTTMMRLTGSNAEELDEIFEKLNSAWIAEIGLSFADDRIASLRNLLGPNGWVDIAKISQDCKLVDADLELVVIEEPEK